MDIKTIICEINNYSLVIDMENYTIFYNGINKKINEDILFNYLTHFFSIINDWEEEYIDYSIIDGNVWRILITYTDGSQKQYRGKAKCPINFSSFEEINYKLIKGEII